MNTDVDRGSLARIFFLERKVFFRGKTVEDQSFKILPQPKKNLNSIINVSTLFFAQPQLQVY